MQGLKGLKPITLNDRGVGTKFHCIPDVFYNPIPRSLKEFIYRQNNEGTKEYNAIPSKEKERWGSVTKSKQTGGYYNG